MKIAKTTVALGQTIDTGEGLARAALLFNSCHSVASQPRSADQEGDAQFLGHQLAREAARVLDDDGTHAVTLDPNLSVPSREGSGVVPSALEVSR